MKKLILSCAVVAIAFAVSAQNAQPVKPKPSKVSNGGASIEKPIEKVQPGEKAQPAEKAVKSRGISNKPSSEIPGVEKQKPVKSGASGSSSSGKEISK